MYRMKKGSANLEDSAITADPSIPAVPTAAETPYMDKGEKFGTCTAALLKT